MDVRKPVASRVLLVGGGAALPGLDARLRRAVVALTEDPTEARFHPLRALAAQLTIVASPFARGVCTWTGGTYCARPRTPRPA
jgi:actin-related protein